MSAAPGTSPDPLATYRAAPLFSISLAKLTLLSISTFGIYEWYWFLKQWESERRREGASFSPVWRALVAPCYAFSLFRRIRDLTTGLGVPATWPAFALGLAYLVASLARMVPLGPLSNLFAFTFVPLLFVQRSANALNRAVVPELPPNQRYSVAEVAMIVFGVALQIVAIRIMNQLGDLLSQLQGSMH